MNKEEAKEKIEVFDLENKDKRILQSKAYKMQGNLFIVGTLENDGKINCNTLPSTRELIEGCFDLKFINKHLERRIKC